MPIAHIKSRWKRFIEGTMGEAKCFFKAIETHDHQKMVAMMVSNPVLIEHSDAQGNTPLMNAVICKNNEAVRLLILHGANINRKDLDGWTAFSWAFFVQNTKARKILLKQGRSVAVSQSDDLSGAGFGAMAIQFTQ